MKEEMQISLCSKLASQMSPLMLQIPNSPLLASVILIILAVIWKTRKDKRSSLPLLPGPTKLPIIGNLHLFAGHPQPHHLLGDIAKKHGPIMSLRLGQVDVIVISSSELAREVLKTNELMFAQRPRNLVIDAMSYGQGGLLFAPHEDYWREIRKLCVHELLGSSRVDTYRSIREDEVLSLVQEIKKHDHQVPINFSEKINSLTSDILALTAFGKKCRDAKEFVSLLCVANKLMSSIAVPVLYPDIRFLGYLTGSIPAIKSVTKKIGKVLEDIINGHKRKRSDHFRPGEDDRDLVDVLLTVQESSKLADFSITTNQIKDIIFDIYLAGTMTTSITITYAMSLLLKHPTAMKTAQAEVREILQGQKTMDQKHTQKLVYLKSVIKETLRLYPPISTFPREARERCEIAGYAIPIGARVVMNARAIGRDPQRWMDAESFNPERFLQGGASCNVEFKGFHFDLIPFGAGRRMCPGISFGMAEVELALAQLLYHFDWKLPNGMKPDELDMTEEYGAAISRKSDLYVIATPHFA